MSDVPTINAEVIKKGAVAVISRLSEIRSRLVKIAIVLCVTATAGWYYSPHVLAFLASLVPKVIFLTPGESFVTQMKLAFILGGFAALPFILWQIWSLVAPSLPVRQRRGGFWVVPTAFLLFGAGAAFCFYVMIPFALKFFMSFSTPDMKPAITFGNLVSFTVGLVVPFGLVFETPIVAYFLSEVGILRPGPLAKGRKYAVLFIAMAAAIITPTPDMFNMGIMGLPMYLMFELSILVSWLVWRRRKRQAKAAADGKVPVD